MVFFGSSSSPAFGQTANSGTVFSISPAANAPSFTSSGSHSSGFETLFGHNTNPDKLISLGPPEPKFASSGSNSPAVGGKEYYTEPSIEELESKERAEPGFCCHVKDFVVGRKDIGSIKFLGETDVRGIDIAPIVQFNDLEVVVYLDDSKKPPIGEGLNKPAEITLLDVKCVSKLTKKQYLAGPQLRRFVDKLMEKAEEIGAEFT